MLRRLRRAHRERRSPEDLHSYRESWTGGAENSAAGGLKFCWPKRLHEDLTVFGIIAAGKEGREASAKRREEWYDGI